MTWLTMPLLLLWIVWLVGFLFAGWTARSYVGERWLPYLAMAWTFGPILVSIAIAVALLGFSPEIRVPVQYVANGIVDFGAYGVLALMLVLIGRRLPNR